jgi:hypothetical protein
MNTQDLNNIPKDRAKAALWYAEKFNWRVMPLHAMRSVDGVLQCSCADAACGAPGKHPLVKNGEASNKPDKVKAWWKKWPFANIGFWLEESGLAALDIDVGAGKDGAATLRDILAGSPLQATLSCATPSGGKHIYYKDREGLPNKSNALGKGLDIWRGKHYLILPPSNHKAGGEYQWEQAVPPIDWPDILMPRAKSAAATNGTTTDKNKGGRPESKEKLDPLDKDEVAKLMHSLAYVDATDRDTWVHVGYILARLFNWSDEGWEYFREWAATAHNYDEKKTAVIYRRDSKNPPEGAPMTTSYIFKLATKNPNFTRWEKKDNRLRFFQTEGYEADDLYNLTSLVRQADLELYEREGRLIEVIRIGRLTKGEKDRLAAQGIERADSYCITRELTNGQFVVRASPHIAWWKKVGKDYRNTDFDRRTVGDFIGLGDWPGLKKFRAFVLHPTIRSLANPTLLTTTGFDEESGLYLEQQMKLTLPQKATLKDAKAAVKVLMSPFEHYQFIDDAVSRASVLGLILTVGVRHCFRTAPMFLATSPIVGSGKTKLMTAIGTLWYGAPPPTMVFVENEEEMEKRIGASVMAGDRIMLFDNVQAREVVNDRTMNMILTSGTAQFRILGESTQVRMSVPSTLMMTGNMMSLGPDLGRRTVEIRIDPQGPSPVTRKFPFEPVEFVQEHRKILVEAAMTIFQAYFASLKAPWSTSSPIASFEDWTVIRDIVQWLGLEDIGNFAKSVADDDDLYYPKVVQRMVEFLLDLGPELHMLGDKKHSVSDIIPIAVSRGNDWDRVFHDAIEVLGYGDMNRDPKKDDPRSVGAVLARFVDQEVTLADGRRVRLKSVKRRQFWLAAT